MAERGFWAALWHSSEAIYYCANGMHIYGFIMGLLVSSKLKIPAQQFQPLEWYSIVKYMP